MQNEQTLSSLAGSGTILFKGRARFPWQITTLPMIFLISVPIVALFFQIQPEEFLKSLKNPQVIQAVQLSMLTSMITVGLTVVFGTPVAYLIYKDRSKFVRIIDILLDLPTILPPAVSGLALLLVFGRNGILGELLQFWKLSIPFSTAAVIIAQTFVASPLYIKTAAVGFANIDCELKKSAALDGATRWQVFRHIMLPMSWVAIVTGAVMTWARALGEFGATIIFAGNFPGRTQTMPLAIYMGFEIDIQIAITLALVMVSISFIILAIVKWILRDRS